MSLVKVVFVKNLKAYPDGFTLCMFEKGKDYEVESVFAAKQIERGFCKEAKPAKDTKPEGQASKETKPENVEKKTK